MKEGVAAITHPPGPPSVFSWAPSGRWRWLWPCLLTFACATTGNAPRTSLEERCNGGSAWECEVWGDQLMEGQQPEPQQIGGPSVEAPLTGSPLAEGPVAMAPVTEGPLAEAPLVRAPPMEGPPMEGPPIEGSPMESPLVRGPREEAADRAFGMACAKDSTSACLKQGKLRLRQGNLEGAEPPLRQAYEAGLEEGALALADLYEARGDVTGASRLRWEALAIDKSTVEFALGLRIPWGGKLGGALDMNVQPMGLGARRLILGANLSFPHEVTLNATAGYQHFVSNWAAPYARVLVGSQLGERSDRLNLGAEVGVKVFGGEVGHLGVAVGSSIDGSFYTVVEGGLDWLLTLYVLAHAL